MENPIKIDDLGGKKLYFWKHPYNDIFTIILPSKGHFRSLFVAGRFGWLTSVVPLGRPGCLARAAKKSCSEVKLAIAPQFVAFVQEIENEKSKHWKHTM